MDAGRRATYVQRGLLCKQSTLSIPLAAAPHSKSKSNCPYCDGELCLYMTPATVSGFPFGIL